MSTGADWQREWRQTDAGREARRVWLATPAGQAYKARQGRNFRTSHPEYGKHWKARKKIELAGREPPECCEVCDAPGAVEWDHDHQTGLFRGWICGGCNRALGNVQDDPERLELLARYLRMSQKVEVQ